MSPAVAWVLTGAAVTIIGFAWYLMTHIARYIAYCVRTYQR